MSQSNEKINPTFIDYDKELADYFNISVEEVRQKRSELDFEAEWHKRKISNPEEANKLYAESEANLFRQARKREKRLILYRRVLKDILSTQIVKELKIAYSGNEYRGKSWAPYTKNTVLDYGCGIGDIGLMMATLGYEVDLLEIGDSKIEKFIKWRFNKRYLAYKFIPYGRALDKEKYDIVFCVDLLEHHENPRQALRDIYNSMKVGGYLFLSYGWFERVDYIALGDWFADDEFIKPFLKKNFLSYDKFNFWYIKK